MESKQVAIAPLVAIVGPNASGKSAIGMTLAQHFNGEIVAADSRTVYRHMNIGTGKPSFDDRSLVPHHCLDLVNPDERFTAADFKACAVNAISRIHKKQRLPILVGGTGLYIDSVLFDFQFADDPNPEQRIQLEKLSDETLQQKLDEMGAKEVNRKNRRHVIRFIETGGTPKEDRTLRKNTLVLGVERSKNELRERITQRVEQMFRAGLRKEVDELVGKYDWNNEALTGIGYREFRQHYESGVSMSKVKRDIVQASVQYAKRQRTWFQRNTNIQWVNNADEVVEIVNIFLEDTVK